MSKIRERIRENKAGWLVALAVALATVIWIVFSGCATFDRGLDRLDQAAARVEKFNRGVDRVLDEAVNFYHLIQPYVVNQCETGAYPADKCEKLAEIDLQLIALYEKIEDGSADLAALLEGFDLAAEAFRLQVPAVAAEG